MRNIFKNIPKKGIYIIVTIVLLWVLYISAQILLQFKAYEVQLAKKDITIESVTKTAESLENTTQIQLKKQIWEHTLQADHYLTRAQEIESDIKKLETELEKVRKLYEEQILLKKCKVNQSLRDLESKEIDDNFCKDSNNLEQFRENNTNVSFKSSPTNKPLTTGFIAQAQASNNNSKIVYHKYWPRNDQRQEWLQYFYTNSGYDKDLVLTFLAENGNMGLLTKSGLTGSNGYHDYGLCQINPWYHPDILGHGGSYGSGKYFVSWFYEPNKQMDYCIKKYKWGTKFYGYNVRHRAEKLVVFE